MRPPKPRIAKNNLKWVWRSRARGGFWQPVYRVTWTEGGKRREKAIALDWQGDPRKLDEEYWRAQAGTHERQAVPSRYTWQALVEMWRQDPRAQGKLKASTKAAYRRVMDDHLERNGHKDVRRTTRAGVMAIHTALAATPRKADWRVQVISLLWNYGVRQGWPLGDNPARAWDHYGPQTAFAPWPAWMVAALDDAPAQVQAAARLILGTGQRPGAAIGMRHDQFQGDFMEVLDEKRGEHFEVYCPDDLRAYVESLPREGDHIIAQNLRQPLGYDAVYKLFQAWRRGLGPRGAGFTLHGLRKLAIVQLAEAGCSDAEIQAVTNQSMEMVNYYRQRADRKRLSESAQRRRTEWRTK